MADFWSSLASIGAGMKAANNPTWARLAQDQQKQDMLMQQQAALQDLATRYSQGNVGPLGPQKALGLDDLVTQGAMITGDIGPLASLAAAREKDRAEQQRRSQLLGVLFGDQMPTAGVSPADGSAPLNVRNNNPGNMRPVGGNEGFQKFATPEEGLAAMANDLTAKITGNSPAMEARFGAGYQPTLANVLTTWAPPEENDTQNYVDFVSAKTGIAPDDVLSPMDIQKIMPAMIEMEGGKKAVDKFVGGTNQVSQPLPQTTTQQTGSSALETAKALAMLDPEQYADDYIQAQLQATQDEAKAAQEAEKTVKEEKKNLTEGERDLRKEFEGLPDVKQFRDVEGAYKRINKAAEKGTPAGDLALIFNYMKMLDPGSTVREGEFANAATAAPLLTRLGLDWSKVEGVWKGNRLTPEMRDDFLDQAKGQYLGAEELFNVRAGQYEDLAKEYEFKPSRIVTRARQKVERTAEPMGVMQGGWDDAKEKRYQELLKKRGG